MQSRAFTDGNPVAWGLLCPKQAAIAHGEKFVDQLSARGSIDAFLSQSTFSMAFHIRGRRFGARKKESNRPLSQTLRRNRR
jgi:hypothetical protein